MMDLSNYYKSEGEYLKAGDLAQGKKYPLTIASVGVTQFEDNGVKTEKVHLTFKESEKKFTVNKTNYTVISSHYGHDGDNWIGKQIFLFRTMTQFGDKMVDCLRVEMPMQEATLGQPEEPMPVEDDLNDADIPF